MAASLEDDEVEAVVDQVLAGGDVRESMLAFYKIIPARELQYMRDLGLLRPAPPRNDAFTLRDPVAMLVRRPPLDALRVHCP